MSTLDDGLAWVRILAFSFALIGMGVMMSDEHSGRRARLGGLIAGFGCGLGLGLSSLFR